MTASTVSCFNSLILGRLEQAMLGLPLQQSSALLASQPIWGGSGPHPSKPQHFGGNRMPERGRCRRPAVVGWPGRWLWPPPQWHNSDEFGSSWFLGNRELSSKNGVGWSWRLRMADTVLKVASGKGVRGWWRQEEGASLGLLHPNTIEWRDRSWSPWKALQKQFNENFKSILKNHALRTSRMVN